MEWFNELPIFLQMTSEFIFWYPFVMCLIWMSGAMIFVYYREKSQDVDFNDISWPGISILVPCYNEEDTIEETVKYLSELSYPNFEIIVVNDGSRDRTGEIIRNLATNNERLRVIDCNENNGKANALHIATHASKFEYLVCVDSDAILDDHAPYYLIQHFLKNGERVGAVTGNPRIRNRDTLLSKLQIVEYASIIGSIKRTQRIIGKIITVSGVIVAFRKKALMNVGLWDRDMITDDIAVSWKLQKNFWDIRYEPRALCWMLVPETLLGLWKQRLRWAQGSQEVIIRHWDIFKDWKQRRLWIIYVEQVLSTIWSFAWLITTIYFIIIAKNISDLLFWLTFSSFALTILNFFQLFISMKNDLVYDNIKKYYFWAAWYPALYWILNVLVVVAALPRAIKSRFKGGYATWQSPDRGEIISK